MRARVMLGLMLAGTAVVMLAGARTPPAPKAPLPEPARETPWLSREATREIVGPGGALGPLFADVFLGGPAPSVATRARIADFAKTNGVTIDLEVVDGDLAAIVFEVTYGGCCGYEGADALGMRLGRPRPMSCCVCGTPTWTNAWSIASETGVHARVRINVNRVTIRWERLLAHDELLERAERLLGADRHAVAREAGPRWNQISDHHYLLEVPYAFGDPGGAMDLISPFTSSLEAYTEGNEIVRVDFLLHRAESEPGDTIVTTLRSHWGRPQIASAARSAAQGGAESFERNDETWTWRKRDKIIEADVDPDYANYSRVSIRRR